VVGPHGRGRDLRTGLCDLADPDRGAGTLFHGRQCEDPQGAETKNSVDGRLPVFIELLGHRFTQIFTDNQKRHLWGASALLSQ
jgi:hypothetical protein